MTKKQILEAIILEKVVAIIRLKTTHDVPIVVESLVAGGIKALEITTNTPDFLKHIEKARKIHSHTLVGAGTVLTSRQAQAAIDSGAQFLVTPNTNPDILASASKSGVPVLMGAYTPTEVLHAHQTGADIIKLFPAGIAGIPYLKSIMAPLDHVKIFAVGGINSNNARSWLEAGAAGVGIGSQLIAKGDDGRLDIEGTISNARQLLSVLQSM